MTATNDRDLGHAMSASLDDRPVGPYEVDVRLFLFDRGSVTFSIDAATARALRVHLDNALDRLAERAWSDAVCGDCDVCKNTRMTTEQRHGKPWTIHCPVCRPKIDAAEAAAAAKRSAR